MTKSIIILVSLSLAVAIASLAITAGAECVGCRGDENWDYAQKLNEIGNPVQQTATPAWGPSVARLTSSQFETNANKSATSNSGKSSNPAQTPAFTIDLKNASAEPNIVSPKSPVKITAVFGGDSAAMSAANMTAYALIQNSVGVQVGNVTLDHTFGTEYSGIWTASIATGTYNAAIVASASGASRTFNDAVKIEINDSGNSSSSSRYTKLG